EAGGMEYPTFFTADNTTQVEAGTAGRYFLDFVTVHEFGHGYFFGILGSNEFEEPMLDEGMNEYWDQRLFRTRKQGINPTPSWVKRLGINLSLDNVFDMERLGANLADPADPLGDNSWTRLSSGSFGTVYSRTATLMRQIEDMVGTPAMERAMKLYYERWKFRHPSVADLREALAEGTGKRDIVEANFNAFIYATGRVDDRVASIDSREKLPLPGYRMYKGKQVLVGNKQLEKSIENRRKAWKAKHPKAKEWEGAFPYHSVVVVRREGPALPQTLRVSFADGSHRDMPVTTTGSWQRFTFDGPAKAVSAQLDPHHLVNMDQSQLNDSRSVEPDKRASRRWFGDVATLLQSLFALLASV
ncbi:MAG: M1 family aminopeptidase, partial [Thermomonas sp.]